MQWKKNNYDVIDQDHVSPVQQDHNMNTTIILKTNKSRPKRQNKTKKHTKCPTFMLMYCGDEQTLWTKAELYLTSTSLKPPLNLMTFRKIS